MRRLWRWLKRLALVVVVLALVLLIAAGGLLSWLIVRGFPQREGSATLAGLGAPVRVVRDANGIAHIYASTTEDLFAAQGYVHASERMWQMEVWRRTGSGRLAELFGDSQWPTDHFIRTLGWRQSAEADLAVLSDEGRRALDAYARGVNAWLDTHPELPLPFVVAGFLGPGGGLAGFRPEPWTAVDTLTWQKVQAWSLGSDLDRELFRVLAARRGISEAALAKLLPGYDMTRPVVVPTGHRPPTPATTTPPATGAAAGATALLDADTSLRALLGVPGGLFGSAGLLGSNAWAVAPARSANGHALVANDPHLELRLPNVWY
ncbi:MAG TPA: penicillin acylase family protein, partial [Candidatus Limnocylindrales bacterium]